MATSNFENLEMGPCNVSFKATDLGLTKGGVEVKMSTDSTDITVDQFGGTIIDQVIKGRAVTVTVPLAERDLPTLASVLPGSTLVTNATTQKSKLTVKSGVGISLRSLAGVLVCHPIAYPDSDKSHDFVVPIAMCKGDMSFSFVVDNQRVYSVEFTGYVDLDTDELVVFGDPSLTA